MDDYPFKLERATFKSRDITRFIEDLREAVQAVLRIDDLSVEFTDQDDRDGNPTVAMVIDGGFILYKTPLTFNAGKPAENTVDGWALDATVTTPATREEPEDQDFVELSTTVGDTDAIDMFVRALFNHLLAAHHETLADEAEAEHHAEMDKLNLPDDQTG